MVKWIVGLVAVIFAALFALPSNATAAPASAPVITYTYDGQHHAAVLTYATHERGPPAADDRATNHDADGLRPVGASARPNAPTATLTYAYDSIVRLVPITPRSRAAEGQVGRAEASSALVQRSLVAANAGSKLGWSVGDDVYSLTKAGNSPAWSTVRARFWKNEAANPQLGSWSSENLARMERGFAPQRYNLDKGGMESMELSHEPVPFRDGGTEFIPRWPQDHAAVDEYRYPGY